MARSRRPEQIAEELLKLLADNAKPLVTRSGSNGIKIQVQGKTFAFEVAPQPGQRRRDIS